MTAELSARRTAAAAILADFRREEAASLSFGGASGHDWLALAQRLAWALTDLLDQMDAEDAAEVRAAFPDFEIARGSDLLWHARLKAPGEGQTAPHLARSLAELAAKLNGFIAGGGR